MPSEFFENQDSAISKKTDTKRKSPAICETASQTASQTAPQKVEQAQRALEINSRVL